MSLLYFFILFRLSILTFIQNLESVAQKMSDLCSIQYLAPVPPPFRSCDQSTYRAAHFAPAKNEFKKTRLKLEKLYLINLTNQIIFERSADQWSIQDSRHTPVHPAVAVSHARSFSGRDMQSQLRPQSGGQAFMHCLLYEHHFRA